MRQSKKKGVKDRMFWREGRGWYLDMRALGAGRSALVDRERGESGACQDFDRAYELAKARLELGGEDPGLRAYARHHLQRKALRRRPGTIERDEISLRRICDWLECVLRREPRLSDVNEAVLLRYIAWRGPQVAEQTLLHELHALSNLFKRAIAEHKARFNPVPNAKVADDVTVHRDKPDWLEIGEAASLLRVTREMDAEKLNRRCPYLYPIVATGLLSGGRPGEVRGMERRDIDFEGGRVWFRHNEWRRLKRAWHERSVPLWPQLLQILEDYIDGQQPRDLMFPSHLTGRMYTNLNDGLRAAFRRTGLLKETRFYILRHTYCATRLQTLDRGQPVSAFTVAEEMGHRDLNLIMKTYGHLQRDRQRLSRVEYREASVTDIGHSRVA